MISRVSSTPLVTCAVGIFSSCMRPENLTAKRIREALERAAVRMRNFVGGFLLQLEDLRCFDALWRFVLLSALAG